MRGALEKLPGISKVDVEEGSPDISVEYDKGKIDADKILAALEKTGEPIKKKS